MHLHSLPLDILEFKIFYYLKYWDLVHLSFSNKYFYKRLRQVKLLEKVESWPNIDLKTCDPSVLRLLLSFKWKFNKINADSEIWINHGIPSCFSLKLHVDYSSDMQRLANQLKSNSVTELCLSENPNLPTADFDCIVQHLGRMTKLRELKMCKVNVNMGILNTIQSQLVLSHINRLVLYKCEITDKIMSKLSPILSSTKIKYMDLNVNHLDDDGLASLGKVLPKSKITHLKVSQNVYGRPGLVALANGLIGSELIYLEIYSHRMLTEEFSELFQVLPMSKLERLEYSSVIPRNTVNALIENIPKSNLTYSPFSIDLQYKNRFLQSVSQSKIVGMVFSADGSLGNQHARIYASFIKKMRIEKLCISNMAHTGLERLLTNFNSNLQELDLRHNRLGDNGLLIISRYLPSTVKKLDLSFCLFKDTGLNYLKKLKLHQLILQHLSVSNDTIVGFIMAVGKSISFLDLSHCTMNTELITRVGRRYPVIIDLESCDSCPLGEV
ncbi:hypothetical protein HDV06_002807 [Boothiomyces sp. JEL0866]|nr:hypothetical protein HDV06_002807 [Boothiomyces sp. JEL0866]